MTLSELGFRSSLETDRKTHGWEQFDFGRVSAVHKDRYSVKTTNGDQDAELVGHLRYTAQNHSDWPVIGDWVAISLYDENKVLIQGIYPRYSMLERQSVGKQGEKHGIAANLDVAFIVQAVDRDFNLNRLDRYLTICYQANITPVLLLNKTDLIPPERVNTLLKEVNTRHPQLQVFAISNTAQTGIEALKTYLQPGKTYCLLGSSGVGKSTLTNTLSGEERMKTGNISDSTHKGKHVTSHRELMVLASGGIVIDNPGMRELGIADAGDGLQQTFRSIDELAEHCRFSDCSHTGETGCAVINAVQQAELPQEVYENYLKVQREKAHFEASVAEKRKKDKAFGKMVKQFVKGKNTHRYT